MNSTDMRPTRTRDDGEGETEASGSEPATPPETPAGSAGSVTEPATNTSRDRPPVVRRVGELGLVAEAASALTTLRQLDPDVSEVDRVNQALIAWESLELWRASGYRFTIAHPCGAARDVTWTRRGGASPGAVPVRGGVGVPMEGRARADWLGHWWLVLVVAVLVAVLWAWGVGGDDTPMALSGLALTGLALACGLTVAMRRLDHATPAPTTVSEEAP